MLISKDNPIQSSLYRLVIHHHHHAYLDENGKIWLTSTIGRWVDALADYFQEVGLLLYQNYQQLPQLDTPISKPNVKLHSLGPRKKFWERAFTQTNLRQVCIDAGKKNDALLIRGFTPHQHTIWRNTPTANKAFLLVGSLEQNNQQIPHSLLNTYIKFLRLIRLNEFRRIANSQTLILANSPVLVNQVESKYNKQVRFVPTNSIRKSEFAPFQTHPVNYPWKLLYCGRLDINKGLRELINAVAVLNQQGYACHLDIVGTKLEPVYSDLLELIEKLGIEKKINWHGFLPFGQELFNFYQSADVFLLPSYTEGFPRVIWEAAANCCPVIVTSVGGIPAILEHEKHALLIPSKDIGSIAAAVKRLLSDEPLRKHLVENAYQHALGFSVEACAEKLANTLTLEWYGHE